MSEVSTHYLSLYEHLYDKDRPQERFRKYKTKVIMKQRKKKLNYTFKCIFWWMYKRVVVNQGLYRKKDDFEKV